VSPISASKVETGSQVGPAPENLPMAKPGAFRVPSWPFVSRVFSANLKSGVSADLGPKTLLLGPSASGKSAVIGAIEAHYGLGLSDLQGRDVVRLDKRQREMTLDGQEPDVDVVVQGADVVVPRLLYREVEAALARGPVLALAGLVGMAGPDGHREASAEVAELDAARSVMQRYWKQHAAGEVAARDPQFLRWFAMERTKVAREWERSRVAFKRELKELYAEVEPAARKLAKKAAAFVPERLGSLVLATGTAKQPRCSVGLSTKGCVRFGLSGFEWSACVTALACAMANPAQLCLCIPSDRAVDADSLGPWLDCLTAAQCQILVTSVVRPRSPPARWTIWEPS